MFTSDSVVWKNTREPSSDTMFGGQQKVCAWNAPLPPFGPLDTSVVTDPVRS